MTKSKLTQNAFNSMFKMLLNTGKTLYTTQKYLYHRVGNTEIINEITVMDTTPETRKKIHMIMCPKHESLRKKTRWYRAIRINNLTCRETEL